MPLGLILKTMVAELSLFVNYYVPQADFSAQRWLRPCGRSSWNVGYRKAVRPEGRRSRLHINRITFWEGRSIPGAPYLISSNVINARMSSDKWQKRSRWISYSRQQIPTLARPPRPRPTGHIAFSICNMEHNYTNSSQLHYPGPAEKKGSLSEQEPWLCSESPRTSRNERRGRQHDPRSSLSSFDCPSLCSVIPCASRPSFLIPYFPPTPKTLKCLQRLLNLKVGSFSMSIFSCFSPGGPARTSWPLFRRQRGRVTCFLSNRYHQKTEILKNLLSLPNKQKY